MQNTHHTNTVVMFSIIDLRDIVAKLSEQKKNTIIWKENGDISPSFSGKHIR